jgi:hypothetical protein
VIVEALQIGVIRKRIGSQLKFIPVRKRVLIRIFIPYPAVVHFLLAQNPAIDFNHVQIALERVIGKKVGRSNGQRFLGKECGIILGRERRGICKPAIDQE